MVHYLNLEENGCKYIYINFHFASLKRVTEKWLLLHENFEAWFQEQLTQLSAQDQICMEVTPNQQAA
ncbi:hypothetical protein [Scytonema sp. PRP1]|uniref:hypothetical protein n=1 Tax=Scytonema sp. PRP1 TaxID=3120513 RepID=UPI002FCFE83D